MLTTSTVNNNNAEFMFLGLWRFQKRFFVSKHIHYLVILFLQTNTDFHL